MEYADTRKIVKELSRFAGAVYKEFIRVPAISAGIYSLSAGATDPQQPHSEDEIYYVISGKAKFTVGGQVYDAQPGAAIFVPAQVEHRFTNVTADLAVLVIFAPAETGK
jgi:quercetin dioxygenase-like cupin family protein